jgi:putative salt-induced outer membrane protein
VFASKESNPLILLINKEKKMKFPKTLMAALIGLSSSSILLAQDAPREASIALGYVGTTGNTETTALNAEVLLTYRTLRWTHNGKFQGLAAEDDSVTTAERYYLEEKSDFNLDERQYLFGKGSYNDDRFSGFGYQATVAAGYGRYFAKSDVFTLDGFGGLGYRENDVIDGDTEGEGIVTLGEKVAWAISPSSSFVQSFSSDIGEEITVSRFEIGLQSNIIERIATKIAFQARNISEVPAGNKKTDTQTSVSLVYSF